MEVIVRRTPALPPIVSIVRETVGVLIAFLNYSERRLSGNQMTLKKSCLNEPLVLLDDGTAVQATGVCEIRQFSPYRDLRLNQ